ncbi:MAG: transketolase [Campylobacteraceae bacterium]|jgi:transketolase|nr:transketolase [Campylobacteraceae bacterium]
MTVWLENKAEYLRKRIIKVCALSGAGHITSSLSVLDILVSLYLGNILRYSKNDPKLENRDRLILSKGHATLALYNVLSEAGFFKKKEVDTFCQKGTKFGGLTTTHVPGVECYTGSLGHGLSFAVGTALAARLKNSDYLTFVITGDGELQEGSIWEAAMSISQFNLNNLIWIIDKNNIQLSGKVSKIINVEPLEAKLQSFGFDTVSIDGHDYKSLMKALAVDRNNLPDKPLAIIANTLKGKGIPLVENQLGWHGRKPSVEEMKIIMEQLNITPEEFDKL